MNAVRDWDPDRNLMVPQKVADLAPFWQSYL